MMALHAIIYGWSDKQVPSDTGHVCLAIHSFIQSVVLQTTFVQIAAQ